MKNPSLNLYQSLDSPIHHLDARVKVILTILVIISNVLIPDGNWLALTATWTILLVVTQLSRIKLNYLFSRSLIVLPFALAAVTTIFSTPGQDLFTLPWPEITVTDRGIIRFGTIMFRSWISVQAAILLSTTTEFADLIHALRHLKIPGVLVSIISFMYRYLFVLIEEARRLLRARSSRSARIPGVKKGGSLFWNIKTVGSMVGQLFLRSIERSERIYQAMQSRGYQGHLLTLNPHQMNGKDWITLVGMGSVILLIQILIL